MGSNVLEVGCGTGQMSIALSRYARHIYGIDLSKNSLIEGKKFINSNNIKSVHLFRMNIFKLFFEENTFDVIISNGVLHHTYNPKLAFSKLVRVLKPGGIIVIGLYHRYGRIIQKIRQSLINNFGDSFKFLDKRFREKISDKKKYAWFLDQYKNPSETTHTYLEVLNWFKDENIEFLSSIPFDFNPENKLFQKREAKNRFEIFLNEISLAFNLQQISEGGFFVMIGKKL
jgi:ubiquinone/menaquinone biosynthesis C-methylase UbiE